MVFFTCNSCGSCLKKSAVSKHVFQCQYGCNMVACMDCSKDFNLQSYKEHTSCITEREKYSGKGYKPPPSHNKGEKKQREWVDAVRTALDNCDELNSATKQILRLVAQHSNVPRKKAKFINFVKNIAKRKCSDAVIQECWTILENKCKKAPPEPQQEVVADIDKDTNDIEDDNISYCSEKPSGLVNKFKNDANNPVEPRKKISKKKKLKCKDHVEPKELTPDIVMNPQNWTIEALPEETGGSVENDETGNENVEENRNIPPKRLKSKKKKMEKQNETEFEEKQSETAVMDTETKKKKKRKRSKHLDESKSCKDSHEDDSNKNMDDGSSQDGGNSEVIADRKDPLKESDSLNESQSSRKKKLKAKKAKRMYEKTKSDGKNEIEDMSERTKKRKRSNSPITDGYRDAEEIVITKKKRKVKSL